MIAPSVTPWIAPGPYPVAEAHVPSWTTENDMAVAVVARYAVGADHALPVVVLCHGLGGEPDSYAALGNHLAGHGYAVLHPQFRDSLSLAGPALGLTGPDAQRWMRRPHARAQMHAMLFDPEHWLSRVTRVHGVLDSLAAQAHLPVRLRPDAAIVAGHSFGAYTAQLLLGARLHGAGADGDFTHPAVAAGVLMSPQGSGDRGLTPSSWDDVRLPLLVITATRDLGAKGEGLAWRREPFDAARSPLKHLAVVRDGDHFLGGIPDSADDPASSGSPEVRSALAALAVAFADHVHGDRAAGDWLAAEPFAALIDHEHWEQS
jgi:dienelactone hydrolase